MDNDDRILLLLGSLGNLKQLARINECAILGQLPSSGLSLGSEHTSSFP